MLEVIYIKKYISVIIALVTVLSVITITGSVYCSTAVNVPVLMYHDIREGAVKPSETGVVVTPETFKEQMEYLKLAGYHTINVDQYINFMKNKGSLPADPIMITFDDGYESGYKYAYPILKQLGMKGVVNVIVSQTKGEPNYHYWPPTHLIWEQMKEMSDSGVFDIESHTYDLHYYASNGKRNLPAASGQIKINGKLESYDHYVARVGSDFKRSASMLEKNTGKRVRLLSYPYGVGNATTIRLAKEAGYEAVFTIKEGVMRPQNDIMMGKRVKVKGTHTGYDIVRNIYKDGGIKTKPPYYDLEKHWAGKDVIQMMSKGYMKGYPDKTFKPDNPVTRAEMATMISSVFGVKDKAAALPFTDVKPDSWYYGSVSSCYAHGLFTYYGTAFRPDAKATREDAAAAIAPFLPDTASADLSSYKDAGEVSQYAKSAIQKAVAAGIIKGRQGGYLSPKGSVTRAELAVMIERALNLGHDAANL